ncbi:MAG: hypothetical protein KFB97_03475 [Cyanobium sp. M30B3]|nr:MAG: hypothetical protein KFB97_03475 [Cyanobium sp. M30B3]
MAATWVQPAQAVLIYNFYESGGNLVVEGTGSLNLPSSPLASGIELPNGFLELDGGFATGATATPSLANLYFIDGPNTLGAGIIPTFAFSSSDSGISSALSYADNFFVIDETYVSGAAINSSSTFAGTTLASLGIPNSGTLGTWTLVDPFDFSYIGDTISVQVNASASPASVPGPLPILGLAAAFGSSRKLRKRIKLHKGTSDISASTGA